MLQVHNIARLFFALQADSRVNPWHKICAWCGLVYVFSPLDALPELFTGVGLLDDIIVSLIIMQGLLELAPRHVVDEHCARMGIDPRQVFLSVSQTVREARSLYAFVREFGSGWRESSAEQDASGQPEPDRGAAQQVISATQEGGVQTENNPANQEVSRPGARYSAYRKGDGGA
jgi:uncharacterized membrane protein YkvA (DUF1232 family)